MKSKKPAKNIIISHAYSNDNKGDAALLAMLVQETIQEFHPSDLIIFTMDEVRSGETFEGVRIESSFMHYVNYRSKNRIVKLLYGNFLISSTLLWAFVHRHIRFDLPLPKRIKSLVNRYAEADLIIAVGGGYLRSDKSFASTYNLALLLHPFVLSGILGKPTVLFTQSLGPFYRRLETSMLKRVLSKDIALTIVREDKSMQLLRACGIKDIVRSVDTGFLLKTEQQADVRIKFNIPTNALIIGVTVRKWLEPPGQNKYEKALAEALDYIVTQYKAYIVFIPQVTSDFHNDDDRIASEDVYNKMSHQNQALVIRDNWDLYRIKAFYNELDFIIGTRFHSVIFSLTSYVPALAIEYEHKTSGIMHDLKLDKWVINIEKVTASILKKKVDELIREKNEYEMHLHKVLPAYQSKAHKAIKLTREAYEDSLMN